MSFGQYGWSLDHSVSDSVERRLVRTAEQAELDSIWTMENHHLRDGITTAAVTLERTSRIGVVVGTLSPFFRHPIELGLTLANLTRMYPGRTGLNLGAGMPETLERIGIPVRRPVQGLREAIEIIKLLFAGERFQYHGEIFDIERHHLTGENIELPPIFVSAMGPRLIGLAGEIADGVNLPLASSPEYIEQSVSQFLSAAAGRRRQDLTISAEVLVQVGDSDNLAGVRRLLSFHLSSKYFEKVAAPARLNLDHAEIRAAFIRRDIPRLRELISDDVVKKLAAVGTAEEVLQRLAAYRAAGADLILLYTAGDEESRLRTMSELTTAIRREHPKQPEPRTDVFGG